MASEKQVNIWCSCWIRLWQRWTTSRGSCSVMRRCCRAWRTDGPDLPEQPSHPDQQHQQWQTTGWDPVPRGMLGNSRDRSQKTFLCWVEHSINKRILGKLVDLIKQVAGWWTTSRPLWPISNCPFKKINKYWDSSFCHRNSNVTGSTVACGGLLPPLFQVDSDLQLISLICLDYLIMGYAYIHIPYNTSTSNLLLKTV